MALELNGTTGVSLVQDGVVVAADLNSALSDTIGKVKAWVNFNGTGTVAIRASYGVSSISDNGTGDYTVNFTTAMVDANYAITGFTRRETTGFAAVVLTAGSTDLKTTTSCQIRIGYATSAGDGPENGISFFR
tara:strand:+ start:415 stop:813 length:399 start_codon:yes stop_codon:yes gene_type:complete